MMLGPDRAIHSTVMIGAILLLTGCASAEGGGVDGEWVGERYVEGDVTTVLNISGSVWGGKARLVEEARWHENARTASVSIACRSYGII